MQTRAPGLLPTGWRRKVVPGALLLAFITTLASAQVVDSSRTGPGVASSASADSLAKREPEQILDHAHVVRWYEAAAVLGGVALLSTLDQPVQRTTQRHRSETLTDVAAVFRRQGEPVYYATVSLAVLGAGIVTNKAGVRRAGGRLVAAVLLSAIASEGTKRLVGRSRPNERVGAFSFHPFTSLKDSAQVETRGSLPSGHTVAAFAVATSLADDINSPVVDVLLYTVAAGAAWSRIYDNRHWLSDTALGAALGYTTAKVVNGQWRIFGLRPPTFLVAPSGAPAVGWTLPL